MSATDYTRLLSKLLPTADGQDVLRLRTGLVVAVNSDGTADVAISGVTVEDLPVLGDNLPLIVGQACQVLTYRGSLLVLGQVGSGEVGPVVRPNTLVTFGTPSLTDLSITTLTPSGSLVDDGNMYPGSGTTITIPSGQGGEYEIGIVLRYASQATAVGVRQARINVGGVEQMLFQIPTTSALNASNVVVGGTYRAILAAGNTVSFAGFQSSGGPLALTGNSRAWVERKR